MEFEHRSRGPVDVLELSGRLGGLAEGEQLQEHVAGLAPLAAPRVIVDLTAVARIDSGFVGHLLACRDRVHKRGGLLALVLSGLPLEVCRLARLDSLFAVFATQREAVDHFERACPS